jgi:predicted PhzF superfamily epimerase YddE/YHI9
MNITADEVEELQLHEASAKYLLVLKHGAAVRQAKVDIAALRAVFSGEGHFSDSVAPLSLTLTARASVEDQRLCNASGDVAVISRHFAPWVGIDEDPVTGAAHVVLVPYWIQRDQGCLTPGSSLVCFQASERGGELRCVLRERERIGLEGSAVTFLRGTAAL